MSDIPLKGIRGPMDRFLTNVDDGKTENYDKHCYESYKCKGGMKSSLFSYREVFL